MGNRSSLSDGNSEESDEHVDASNSRDLDASAPNDDNPPAYVPDFADIVILFANILRTSRALPAEVLIMALKDFANFQPRLSFSLSREVSYGNNADRVHLAVVLGRHAGFYLSRIEVTVVSKDQGWSSYPNEQGMRNSNTWGELCLASRPTTRHHLYTNIHAGKSYETHKIVYDTSSAVIQDIEEALKEVPSLQELQLRARSQYPAWVNNIRFAEICLFYSIHNDILTVVEKYSPNQASDF